MDKINEIKRIEQEIVQEQFAQVMRDVKREKYLKKATQIYEKRKAAEAMRLDREAFLQDKNFMYRAAYMLLYHLPEVPIGIHAFLNIFLGFLVLAGCPSIYLFDRADTVYLYPVAGLTIIVCFYQRLQLGVYTYNTEKVADLKETIFFLTICCFIVLFICACMGYLSVAITGLISWCISKLIIPNSLMAQVRMKR